jgi:DNA-binding response OmpR family regulator
MKNLNINPLLLVGNYQEKQFFENYFNEIRLVKSNTEALSLYHQNSFFTIFLNADSAEDNAFDICKKIRKNNNRTVIVILTDRLDKEKLQKALPLHLSGCIKRPFKKNQVEDVLSNVDHDLALTSTHIMKLKDGYRFDRIRQILYDNYQNEIKLTKYELELLNLLLKADNRPVSNSMIEHKIWEDDSLRVDCDRRLKNLFYTLRKKLPKDTVVNNYGVGYKLVHN